MIAPSNSLALSQWHMLDIVFVLGFTLLGVQSCRPVHSRGNGFDLACCGHKPHQKLTATCRFRHNLCRTITNRPCRCILRVTIGTLQCVLEENVTGNESYGVGWLDHHNQLVDDFVCTKPALPNPSATFTLDLRLDKWRQAKSNTLLQFMKGLQSYAIVSLNLLAGPSVPNLPDGFFDSVSNLTHITIEGPGVTPVGVGPMNLSVRSLMSLNHVESLTVKNIPLLHSGGLFDLQEAANFSPVIRRLHLEKLSGLSRLSGWLASAQSLHYARFKNTAIEDLSPLVQLQSLEYLYAPYNKIRGLAELHLQTPQLIELDLSYNTIQKLSTRTFRKVERLKFLDLSGNPLKSLPDKVFSRLRSLKWLHLKHTHLVHLSAAHVTGLVSLTELSLQGNRHLNLDTFSLLPLTALETLDLRDCNLTTLPDAVSQACDLKHLWLNFNQVRELPAEVVLHLNRLQQLVLTENPVFENPVSLFLLPPSNVKLLSSVLVSLKQLPTWWTDPCTPLVWWLHLVNGTMTPPGAVSLYKGLFPTPPDFNTRQSHRCMRRYYRISTELTQLYGPLLEKTRCETVRRLRSIDTPLQSSSSTESSASVVPLLHDWWKTLFPLLLVSSALNVVATVTCISYCFIRHIKRDCR